MEQDLEVRRLVRRLCRCIASQQVIAARGDPEQVSRLQPQLEDTAHSVLLGLLPVSASCCLAQAGLPGFWVAMRQRGSTPLPAGGDAALCAA